jgi:hypothetical protein
MPASSDRGVVRVFSGKTGVVTQSLLGPQALAQFGTSVASIGDVNSDGVSDFVVAAPGAGIASMRSGSQRCRPVVGRRADSPSPARPRPRTGQRDSATSTRTAFPTSRSHAPTRWTCAVGRTARCSFSVNDPSPGANTDVRRRARRPPATSTSTAPVNSRSALPARPAARSRRTAWCRSCAATPARRFARSRARRRATDSVPRSHWSATSTSTSRKTSRSARPARRCSSRTAASPRSAPARTVCRRGS